MHRDSIKAPLNGNRSTKPPPAARLGPSDSTSSPTPRKEGSNDSFETSTRVQTPLPAAAAGMSILSPGQGLRTRAKRTTGKQGLRYTPSSSSCERV
jgi:hypothetical protein